MFKLLSTANPKIQKGTKLGYLSFILHLAPSDLSGRNTCPKATPGNKTIGYNYLKCLVFSSLVSHYYVVNFCSSVIWQYL